MTEWLDALNDAGRRGSACVLVTVVATRGSTPREPGAKMCVTRRGCSGSIGGGQLELKATEMARELLTTDAQSSLRRFPLGPSLGQCCGGVAVVLFDPIPTTLPVWVERLGNVLRAGRAAVLVGDTAATAGGDKLVITEAGCEGSLGDDALDATGARLGRDWLVCGDAPKLHDSESAEGASRTLALEVLRPGDFDIVLFGAGHVGTALVRVLSGLPCSVTWVDNREDAFPGDLAPNISVRADAVPEDQVAAARPGSCFLVMTHSHPLDQRLCEQILARGDFRYCGLIGSTAKRRKFEARLKTRGVSASALARLTCPIGIDGIPGKHPGEIAVAVAAELLRVRGALGNAGCTNGDGTERADRPTPRPRRLEV